MVFWNVIPYSLVDIYINISEERAASILMVEVSSTLNMEALYRPETLLFTHQMHHIPEDSHLQIILC
jgi:hypothetical protein